MSRVILQVIAEAAGVPVSTAFKSGHLLSDGVFLPREEGATERGGVKEKGGDEAAAAAVAAVAAGRGEVVPTEVMPVAVLDPEPDAIEELVAGRCGAVLIVPKDTRDASAAAPAPAVPAESAAAAAVPAVVLREGAMVRAALPRGATIVLPGSYNPLHRGHLGLLEAARGLLRAKLELEASSSSSSLSSSTINHPPLPQGGASSASKSSAIGGENASDKAAATAPGEGRGVNEELFGSTGEDDDGNCSSSSSSDSTVVHGVFEVSVANVDKGGLAAEEVRRRAKQFSDPGGPGWPHPVVVTRAPLFSQKVCLCLGACGCV